MCIICIEYGKQKLTLNEAWRNYIEMAPALEEEHKQEIEDLLWTEAFEQNGYEDFLALKENPYKRFQKIPFIPDEEDLSQWYENHGQGD